MSDNSTVEEKAAPKKRAPKKVDLNEEAIYIVEHADDNEAKDEVIRFGLQGKKYNVPIGVQVKMKGVIANFLKSKREVSMKFNEKTGQNKEISKKMYVVEKQ